MPVYKDEERGTWYVRCYYEDFTGKKKQIKKRGFKLQREAKEWEADFLRKQKGSTDMTFRSMYRTLFQFSIFIPKINLNKCSQCHIHIRICR